MLDRVPTKPNRYAVYDDEHNFIRYEYHERADDPTQVGDALNKANLLPDAVATALDLTGNPQVKDALAKLTTLVNAAQTTADGRAQIATGSYTGTGAEGVDNKNSLTLPFTPKKVSIIGGIAFGVIAINGTVTSGFSNTTPNGNFNELVATISGKTIYWYAPNADFQLNTYNKKYIFVVEG